MRGGPSSAGSAGPRGAAGGGGGARSRAYLLMVGLVMVAVTLWLAASSTTIMLDHREHQAAVADLHQRSVGLDTSVDAALKRGGAEEVRLPQSQHHHQKESSSAGGAGDDDGRDASPGGIIHPIVKRPQFAPRRPRVVAELLRRAETDGDGSLVLEGANSVPVDEEDLRRARGSIVAPLVRPASATRDTSAATKLRNAVFDFVAPFLVNTPDDAYPLYAVYGGTIAGLLARAHPNATVIVIATRDDTDGEEVISVTGRSLPPNVIGLHSRELDDAKFEPWYRACHFVTASVMLQRAVRPSRGLTEMPAGKVAELALRALPGSRHMYVALLPSEVQDVEERVDPRTGNIDPNGLPDWKSDIDLMQVRVRRLAVVFPGGGKPSASSSKEEEEDLSDDSGAVVIVEISVAESRRACAKTWGAPLIQWGRKLMASIRNNGTAVSFAVRSVKDTASGRKLGRTIHPLQYIPSVNLDTVLGAGVPDAVRTRLLGEMVGTPRYSDPLPHNWIVGLGGRVLRIDKVDTRYDADVDETKGYWGTSTRGYLHLLGVHLCLPISADGVPEVMSGVDDCDRCWHCCSYLPKARTPCAACLACAGRVIAASNQGRPNATVVLSTTLDRPKCQKTYSSMTSARKVWAKWAAGDASHDKKHGGAKYQCPAS